MEGWKEGRGEGGRLDSSPRPSPYTIAFGSPFPPRLLFTTYISRMEERRTRGKGIRGEKKGTEPRSGKGEGGRKEGSQPAGYARKAGFMRMHFLGSVADHA